MDDFLKSNTILLEDRVRKIYDSLGIPNEERETVEAFLAPLRCKNESTFFHYKHSLRVGLVAVQIAHYLRLDEKALFYAGLLHDIGKAQVNPSTLGKTEGWISADSQEMAGHVIDGYRVLRGCFDFTAEIILWHHRFQAQGYPEVFPQPLHDYSEDTKATIAFYGRILALVDCYDALHRVNDKFGTKKALTSSEIKEKMLEFNIDQCRLVKELYDAGIFITHNEEDI